MPTLPPSRAVARHSQNEGSFRWNATLAPSGQSCVRSCSYPRMAATMAPAHALVLAAALAASEVTSPEASRLLVRGIYEELVNSNTSYSTGKTTEAAEAMARRFLDAGFPAADVFVGGAAPHKANVVARYRGTGAGRPLLLLAHLDVVEAKREDWSIDPFKLLAKDGYFYGRGTGDDKAQAAIWVANLLRYRQEGF